MIALLVGAWIFLTEGRGAEPVNDGAIALIEFKNVPLPEVIRDLARRMRLNILLDPRVTTPPLSQQLVSVRWEGVTAKDALHAILENYGLTLVEGNVSASHVLN